VAFLTLCFLALAALTVFLWTRTNARGSHASGPGDNGDGSGETVAASQPYAKFVKRDDKRAGNWKKDLGHDGYLYFNRNGPGQHDQRLPEYIQELNCVNAASCVWAQTDDARGLQETGQGAARFATCQYSGEEFTISIKTKRNPVYRLSLYCLDWDRLERKERIEFLSGEKVLHSLDVEKMGEGVWLHYEVAGPVDIRVVNVGPHNAVLAGIFFDDSGVKGVPPRAPAKGRPPSGEEALQPGLCAEFFDGIGSFANVEDKPLLKRIVATIRFGSLPLQPGQGLRNWPLSGQCAAIFSGFIKIAKDDTYTFFVESDDGAKLYLDGTLVVNNDGIHGMQEKAGDVALGAGVHRLWLEYYNVGGAMGLNVSMKGKSTARQPLNPDQLLHDPAEE
jgi:hypothetical protein